MRLRVETWCGSQKEKKKPAFSLLGDERLKSLIDLSVFKCTPALVCTVYVCVCVCRCICASECLSASVLVWWGNAG